MEQPANTTVKQQPKWQTFGLIFMSLVAGFTGAWLFERSDLTDSPQQDIVESRQRVISEGEVVTDIAEQVSPSVVSIATESAVRSPDIFSAGYYTQEGAGTGVIISRDGYVITNKHVVPQNTRELSVVDHAGRVYDNVSLVGRDPLNDIAFLKINGVTDLKPAQIGVSSDVEVGQKVVAIGNALGQYEATVTSGIISGVNRSVTAAGGDGRAEDLINLLQTDAAINPGNSGGPLVNISGEVIGISTAVSQEAEGIGFAIPIDDTKGLIKSVLENGEVARAYVGVRYVTITPEAQRQFKLDRTEGAYIVAGGDQSAVISGSPADKAGLKAEDIITKIDDVELDKRNNLTSILSQYMPGEDIEVTYLRGDQTQTATVTLERLDD